MPMTRLCTRLAVVATLVGACGGMAGTEPKTTVNNTQASDATTREEIRAVLDRYVKSVNEADEAILRELWVRADNPRALLCPGATATNWRNTRAIGRVAVSLMQRPGVHRRA